MMLQFLTEGVLTESGAEGSTEVWPDGIWAEDPLLHREHTHRDIHQERTKNMGPTSPLQDTGDSHWL